MIMYWFSEMIVARYGTGAISARYRGTITEAFPMATPIRKRKVTSVVTLVALPAPRAVRVKITPVASRTRCRP
jgi:hypothetical protein